MHVQTPLREFLHLLGGVVHDFPQFSKLSRQEGDIAAALLADLCRVRRQLLHFLGVAGHIADVLIRHGNGLGDIRDTGRLIFNAFGYFLKSDHDLIGDGVDHLHFPFETPGKSVQPVYGCFHTFQQILHLCV
ncbi:hypothetical protein D3C75_806900 [compost metagenome]